MNIQQLRYLCGVVDSKFSVSRAAERLHTSQPGISKQIQMLESELGVEILVRQGNRIIGLTGPGIEIHTVAQRILSDTSNLKRIGEEYSHKNEGRLVVATTHVHARYVLHRAIKAFAQKFVDVSLELRQGNPTQVAKWVTSGEADLGISATPAAEQYDDLVFLPCAELQRSVITPEEHPLLREKSLTLKAIAQYPILTLDAGFTGGSMVIKAFADAGIKPNVAMSATDSDVIKAYVEIGHGIAILPSITYDPERDNRLRAIDASHIFAPSLTHILVQRGKYLRAYMRDFITMIHPGWDQSLIDLAVYNLGK
ncbi:MAG: LysR family transcriptional regulator, cys regulon transcriptional activator [Herbaspirillum sp.]|jgi:LysR family cys regulon transcriptional activator|nr:LysR family transcriptional regulator, cys regulon transcriptional activator [Herbaspirillum sp.]